MGVAAFFQYARERYEIRRRRAAGLKPPWTKDPILATYRFCNVFREDDKVTRWFKQNIRGPLSSNDHVVAATIIFRWFNRIETGKVLNEHNLPYKWNPEVAAEALADLQPLVTGAYMIKTPAKMKKLAGLIWCIDNVWRERRALIRDMKRAKTLEWAHSRLMEFPFLGPFMAYEVITDLRHTTLLKGAADIKTWASAGPGAARGLGRILTGDVHQFAYNARSHQAAMQGEMQNLLALSRHDEYWPANWPRWEMREVEHTLCEFDKYERVRLGEGTPKQRFNLCS